MTKRRLISVLLITSGFVGSAAAQYVGAVYTMTNDPAGNAVVVYGRSADGTLTKSGTYPTGGNSIGFFATGNQNGVLLSADAHCLWAVNSASNSIISYQVTGTGGTSLRRVNSVNSGGTGPVSLTAYQGFLYVLNNGSLFAGIASPPAPSPDNITGFTVSANCSISPLAGSTRSLSQSTGTFPAQLGFDLSGRVVVVTEKATHKIDTWIVGNNGLLSGKLVQASAGQEPFGFAFDARGQLVVTEAGCHMPTPPGVLPGCSVPPDSPAVTSYTVASDGTLILTDHLVDDQAAQCWVVITSNQRFVFTVNALATQVGGTPGQPPAGSVTGYSLNPQGHLTKIGDTPVPTALNSLSPNPNAMVGVPVDASLSRDSQFLYVLSEGDGTINSYSIGPGGKLTLLGVSDVTAVSAITVGGPFPNGLAAQ